MIFRSDSIRYVGDRRALRQINAVFSDEANSKFEVMIHWRNRVCGNYDDLMGCYSKSAGRLGVVHLGYGTGARLRDSDSFCFLYAIELRRLNGLDLLRGLGGAVRCRAVGWQ